MQDILHVVFIEEHIRLQEYSKPRGKSAINNAIRQVHMVVHHTAHAINLNLLVYV